LGGAIALLQGSGRETMMSCLHTHSYGFGERPEKVDMNIPSMVGPRLQKKKKKKKKMKKNKSKHRRLLR
jgi:hypothetical protein